MDLLESLFYNSGWVRSRKINKRPKLEQSMFAECRNLAYQSMQEIIYQIAPANVPLEFPFQFTNTALSGLGCGTLTSGSSCAGALSVHSGGGGSGITYASGTTYTTSGSGASINGACSTYTYGN